MSAWVVNKATIDLLVSAGLAFPRLRISNGNLSWVHGEHHGQLTLESADVIGGKLWAENYASVNDRYPDAEDEPEGLPGPAGFEGVDTLTYTFEQIPGTLDPVVVLKVLSCYESQSCEHAGWEACEARAICNQLRYACINALAGYDEAPWSFDDRTFFTRRDNAGTRA